MNSDEDNAAIMAGAVCGFLVALVLDLLAYWILH